LELAGLRGEIDCCDQWEAGGVGERRHALGRRIVDQFPGSRALRAVDSQSGKLGWQASGLGEVDRGGDHALGAWAGLRISLVAEHQTEAMAERARVEFRRWR